MLIRYRALVYAWLKYADLPEIAGIGLQKQTFVATGAGGAFLLYFATVIGLNSLFLYFLASHIARSLQVLIMIQVLIMM